MRVYNLMILGLFITFVAFPQAIPPVHLQTELSPGGIVDLSWESGPHDGLIENFEDDIAQDFHFWTPQYGPYEGNGFYTITNSYAQISAGTDHDNWGSAVYGLTQFSDFICETVMTNTSSGNSHGIIFRTNGIRGGDFDGYYFLIAHIPWLGEQYAVYRYEDGIGTDIIYWQDTDLINTGEGEVNTLKVVGQGDQFWFYINDVYVNTMTNPLYDRGYVGFMNAPANTVRYHEITCSHTAAPPPSVEPHRGTPVTAWLDDACRPIDHPPMSWGETTRQPPRENIEIPQIVQDDFLDDLDEFVEYRIYRNTTLIGTTEIPAFSDQLPSYGDYTYTITAWYDPEGESIPSVGKVVSWNDVSYFLVGVETVVPHTGGTISYDALLFNETAQTFPNVSYRVYVTLPDSTTTGPVFQRTFTLSPGMSISIPGITQQIPAFAPPGNYFLNGRLFYQGTPVLIQTFQFDKMGEED